MSRSFAGFGFFSLSMLALLVGCSNSPADSQEATFTVVPEDSELVSPPPISPLDDGQLNQAPFVDGNEGPERDSSFELGSVRYPLSAAIGDIWGVSGEHFNVNFTLTDGKFTIMETSIDGVIHNLLTPANASGIFHAEMYSPGEGFSFETYSYALDGADRNSLAGIAFFEQAFIGVDVNNSGEVEDAEVMPVVGGTIEFTGAIPDVELNFSVLLSDGQTVEGHYTGLFDFTQR
ncbi:MAG: hypothetical protein AB8B79_17825 [Granulosicoccus sp.]